MRLLSDVILRSPEGEAAAAPVEPAPPAEGGDPFGGFDGTPDDGPAYSATPEPPAAAPTTPSVAAPAAAPAATPPAAPPAAVAPVTPAAPAAVAPSGGEPGAFAPEPQAAQLDLNDPGAVLTALKNDRAAMETALGQTHFPISQEDLEVFTDNPAQFFQNAGGRILYMTMVNTLAQIQRHVPALVKAGIESTTRHEAASTGAEKAFRTMWPQIGPEHDGAIAKIAQAVRAADPDAPLEQLVLQVGQIAAIRLGLDPRPAAKGQAAAPPRAPQTPSFVPAGQAVELGSGLPNGGGAPDPWGGFTGQLD